MFTRVKVYNYLDIKNYLSAPEKVDITMNNSIFDIFDDDPNDTIGEAVTPAGDHLFQVNEEDHISLYDKEVADVHHIMARLLFLCKPARRYLQTDVAFLCMRVQNPDTDDYNTLSRTLTYLCTTAGLPFILGMDGTNTVSWWVDGKFSIHNDMKIHTGAYMSLGIGAAYASSSKNN